MKEKLFLVIGTAMGTIVAIVPYLMIFILLNGVIKPWAVVLTATLFEVLYVTSIRLITWNSDMKIVRLQAELKKLNRENIHER